MNPSGLIIIYLICAAELFIWLVLCLIVVAVVEFLNKKNQKKNPVDRAIKLATYATIGLIMLMPLEIVYFTMYGDMQFSVWLLVCQIVTVITAVVQMINKKIRKKKSIHWTIKLTGYTAFYAITLFVVWKVLEPYPSNWLGTDKEYRELAYELYNLTLERYEYRKISEGAHGEIVLYFRDDKDITDQNLERTIKQRDHIMIKNLVEEYIKMNGGFQGERIEIEFSEIDPSLCAHAWAFAGHIYNFNPLTGEIGTDASYWFVTDVEVNNCTELTELYHDFSGISASVDTMDDMRELANLCNLTYLELNFSGMDREDQGLEEQYLEELNTLLPDCEIYLNQNKHISPAWGNFAD